MLLRRLSVGTLSLLVVLTLISSRVSSETGDKQLARVKGTVGYQTGENTDFKAIFGRLDLPDDAFAITKPNGQAILRLADSSEIDIGENSKVQVGAFNPAASGNANTIVLNNGALHFNVRHPEGGSSNYKFVTATSQIAVRGTEGFLVEGPKGTQVTCISCSAGDVTVQVGSRTFALLSGQTLTILGATALTATTALSANPTINNPAINQFTGGHNPFNPGTTAGHPIDPTSSLSGSTSGAGAAGVAAGTVAAAAGAVAVAAVVVATSSHTPSPAASTAGPLTIQITYPGASAVYPVAFSWPFSQSNATTQATVTCTPPSIISCTATQTLSGTQLNGTITGSILGPGVFSVSATAGGYTVPPASFTAYSGVAPSVPALNFTSLAPQNLTFTQSPAGAMITLSTTCAAGAAVKLSGTSGPSPLSVTVTPVSAPSTPSSSAACTLSVAGQGGTAAATAAIPINITTTGIGVSTHRRKPL